MEEGLENSKKFSEISSLISSLRKRQAKITPLYDKVRQFDPDDAIGDKAFAPTPSKMIRSEFFADEKELDELANRIGQIRSWVFQNGVKSTDDPSVIEYEKDPYTISVTKEESVEQDEALLLALEIADRKNAAYIDINFYPGGSYGLLIIFTDDKGEDDPSTKPYDSDTQERDSMTQEEAKIIKYYLGKFIDDKINPTRSLSAFDPKNRISLN